MLGAAVSILSDGPLPWQDAFLAVSVLLGHPLEEALAALGAPPAGDASDAGPGQRDEGATLEVRLALGSPSRQTRARAIARAVTVVAVDLEQMRLS
jgi:hypothetical protein